MFHYVIDHPVTINRKDNYLRCVGLMMSNTEYTTQIDDDCWLEDDWLFRAIQNMIERCVDYCFCARQLWENEDTVLTVDNYESIGVKNIFGYHLIETNSLVFNKQLLEKICMITYKNNDYGHDRVIAEYLVNNINGQFDTKYGLNQIVPDFLLQSHKDFINIHVVKI